MSTDKTITALFNINNDLLVFKRLVVTMKDLQSRNVTLRLADAPPQYDNSHAFAYISGYGEGAAHVLNILLEIASKASPEIAGD